MINRAWRFNLFHKGKEVPFIGDKEPEGLKISFGDFAVELVPAEKEEEPNESKPN